MQYCNQPQDAPFDMKTVPIETIPLGATKCVDKSLFFLSYFFLTFSRGRDYAGSISAESCRRGSFKAGRLCRCVRSHDVHVIVR